MYSYRLLEKLKCVYRAYRIVCSNILQIVYVCHFSSFIIFTANLSTASLSSADIFSCPSAFLPSHSLNINEKGGYESVVTNEKIKLTVKRKAEREDNE